MGYIIISWQTRDEQITKDSAGFKDSKEETKELPGERDNAIRNNARRTQARKTTHGLDGQHQDVDRTPIVNRNDEYRDKWRKYVHGVAR